MWRFVQFCIGLFGLALLVIPSSVTAAELQLRIAGKTVKAEVISITDKTVALNIEGNKQSIPCALLEPIGLYLCRKNKSDPNSAQDHLELGQFCLDKKLTEEAKHELAEAKRLKPAEFGAKVDALLARDMKKEVVKPAPVLSTEDKVASKPSPAPVAKQSEEDLVKKYQSLKTGVTESVIDGTTRWPQPDWAPPLPPELALKYSLYTPEIKDVKETFPLLVSLHGAGDTNANYLNMWKGHCEKKRWILLAPKSIRATWCPGSIVRIGQLLQELKAQYPVDPARIYIHGYSDGGTTALLTAAMYPKMFSAAACIHGIPSDEIGSRPEGQGLKGLRVFACGGGKDRFFPLAKFRSTCAALEKLGCSVKLHERPEAGHSYPSDLNETIAQFLYGADAKADENREVKK